MVVGFVGVFVVVVVVVADILFVVFKSVSAPFFSCRFNEDVDNVAADVAADISADAAAEAAADTTAEADEASTLGIEVFRARGGDSTAVEESAEAEAEVAAAQ